MATTLPDSPGLRRHREVMAAWRAIPHAEQCARISAIAPDRPPPPPGGRARVGFWVPSLLMGGAEAHTLAMARSVDAGRVAWQGCCLTGQAGIAHPDVTSAMAGLMPVSSGPDGVRALAARCEVLVTWSGIDPAPILDGLDRKPRVLYVVHLPPRGYAGRIPVPESSVDAFAAVSELALDAVPTHRRGGASVVWNCVDEARMVVRRTRAEMRKLWGVPDGVKVAGYLGRLADEKDPGAMARLAKALPPGWRAVAVGDGPHRDRLAAAGVIAPGPDHAAGDALGAFDALVVPSRYESFGLAIAEGWWAGVPVISTNVGVAALRPGLTRLVPHGASGDELAAAVLADDADRLGTRARVEVARSFARNRLALDRFGKDWTGLLCGLAESRRLALAAACPDRGGVLPISMQDDCGCRGKELSECRAGNGKVPGRVTLRDCLDCRAR